MVCVTDANIWIDVHNADLLDAVFALPFTWRTPDIVLRNEVLTVDRTRLVERGLEERTLSGHELNRILELNALYPNPSPRDLAVLVVADVDGGIVVTGDGPLRAAAKPKGKPFTASCGCWTSSSSGTSSNQHGLQRRSMPWSSKAAGCPKGPSRSACGNGGVDGPRTGTKHNFAH